MKQRLFSFLLLAATLYGVARAQGQDPAFTRTQQPTRLHRWSLDLLAGPALPVGQFASSNTENRSLAPVKTGGLLELSGNYQVSRSFALTLVANDQLNQVKNNPSGIHTTTSSSGPYIPTPYEDWWKIARLMAGGTYSLPLNKNGKFNLLARALGGLQKTRTAGFEEGYVGNPNDPTLYNATALPLTLTYEGDLGFKWKTCSRHLTFIAYGGYNGSLPNYTFSYQTQVETMYMLNPPGPMYTTVKYKAALPTASLVLRAGIEWGF